MTVTITTTFGSGQLVHAGTGLAVQAGELAQGRSYSISRMDVKGNADFVVDVRNRKERRRAVAVARRKRAMTA